MKTISIEGRSGCSTIYVGARLEDIPAALPLDRTVIVTDPVVQQALGNRFPACPVVEIGTGETAKTLDTLAAVCRRFIALGLNRDSFVLAIGGGVVCDLAGFAAATYLRGVRFGFAPTTLLAQVDASVGGKNGVNLDGYKNMVGLFVQPEAVWCDPTVLASLPAREVGCGMAEIIKHGAIADLELIERLETQRDAALGLDPDVIADLVYRSLRIKAAVVARDERESGERRQLNFGHTFGHAVEKVTGAPHGEAVARGMALAARLSCTLGSLAGIDARRLIDLITAYGLPTGIAGEPEALIDALAKDKKRAGDQVHFVLLKALGRAVVRPIPLSILEKEFYRL
ncbi:MAG TPA: 3-dehydroquinate synthase [Desulfobacteraceae bacterium]|nr:3-dehydroquinate synthase [Deltaproteobacteria bacterium]MBW2356292.1 3-dehydroquinate synthase [Deltaproteobacteria bacterium]RLB98723.1 MAG: 3-dehydroquinate synthase [Deltaproteobacteria bacterium]HDI60920.1 3-dehydroquinate synthase [Desulfobacteraceae bacterium]